MASEHDFLWQRLAMVERWLANPEREFIPAEKGRVRHRTRPASHQDLTYKREARLLRKLLARTREGQVLTSLKAWRCIDRGAEGGRKRLCSISWAWRS